METDGSIPVARVSGELNGSCQEEFLDTMEIRPYRLAKDISVPARRINEIVHGKRGISADTALRLSKYFGTTERFWMNLQPRYDLEVEYEPRAEWLQEQLKEMYERLRDR